MSDERKKPGWAFSTAVGIIFVVLYVASIGPAYWLVQKSGENEIVLNSYLCVNYPLIAIGRQHEPTGKILIHYVDWWAL